jgi:hypothetical protein
VLASIKTLGIPALRIARVCMITQYNYIEDNDPQHIDAQHIDPYCTQHNGTEQNYTQHNYTEHNDAQHNNTKRNGHYCDMSINDGWQENTQEKHFVALCWLLHFIVILIVVILIVLAPEEQHQNCWLEFYLVLKLQQKTFLSFHMKAKCNKTFLM